jgi:hypothetical protein
MSGLNFISIISFVSSEAGIHFHLLIASTAATANRGLPPTTSVRATFPFAATTTTTRTVPEAGITFVAVHFDGPGDEGVNEDLKCYATEDYAYQESEVQEANFSYLREDFEALIPYGYEIDCGGFGDMILTVKARRITVERNDRFEDYTTSSYEV